MDLFDWGDIVPLPIEESSTPQLCHILYSDEYKTVMGYLRRLMSLKEYSERSLYVTEKAIVMVASHYTVWQYRFDIIKLLQKDIIKELEWCDDILLLNEKNYQIWHYRQLLIQYYESSASADKFDPNLEFPLIETMLMSDNKNYHVWSYKKWLVEHFKLYDDDKELLFTDKLLALDVRNNSAWNHRFFIQVNRSEFDLESELKFVEMAILLAPQNPSPWNYLQGLYKHFKKDLIELEPFVGKFVDLETDKIQSTHLLELLAKIYQLQNQREKSVECYHLLAERYDPIRANYWKYIVESVL